MRFLIAFAVAVAMAIALRSHIKKHPSVFYALAIFLDALFVYAFTLGLPQPFSRIVFVLIHQCTLSMALFAVVMYIGALPRTSKLYIWLKPIRAELSIAACILALGHIAVYLAAFLPRMVSGSISDTNLVVSFGIAVVLLVLLLLLGATSFNFVKRRMTADSWRKLQKLAYAFYALIYAHLMLMLAPAALAGSSAALIDCVIYTVTFGVYAAMRVYRWRRDAASTLEPEAWSA